ncbi:hypothetical protein MKW98_022711 [Papaver atlanticum]|uniref:Uncharacterized protein n=1 Tax=Papaver atlanticum TaxID=357466 RepID=A0AAD4T3Y8_9MAGN|nr:hypothetical protein MKW98_022711 [Papaver atlanticum]
MNTISITPFLLYFVVLLIVPSSSTSSSLSSSSSTVFSCGALNIKCPFTLEGRPRNCPNGCSSRFGRLMKPLSCGYSPAERILSCENNKTILNYSSKKFYVIDINYEDRSIRLIDPGLERDNCSSMPQHSLPDTSYFKNYSDLSYQSKAVVHMNCLMNISDFTRYINTSPCIKSSFNMFTYVIVNPLVSDFKESCNSLFTSWMSTDRDTFGSYLDVHNEMMNGFQNLDLGVSLILFFFLPEYGRQIVTIGGRRKNLNTSAEKSSQVYFPSWIYNQLNQGEVIEIEDATKKENEIAKKLIIVALWCIQLKPIDRPSMTKVVEMLEGELGLLQIPQKPFSITDVHEEHESDTSSTGITPSTTLTN